SYAAEGSHDGETSIADFVTDANLGSFVLGPLQVNPVELANVSATLADSGRWCEPSPVLSVTDSAGEDVALDTPDCEQAIDRGVADALANGMGGDVADGTAAAAARSAGWRGPVAAKTGTTEASLSAAFLGFTPGLAGATYAFNDGSQTSPLCSSPLRQCGDGNLFGGNEPARAFFNTMDSIVGDYGGPGLPRYNRDYDRGNPARYRQATGGGSGDSNNSSSSNNSGSSSDSSNQGNWNSEGWDMTLDEFN
ncbi:MAG: penicillin-binding protein, partial [Corynebacterium sp.]|nr:penicillin-binding protein [Corynebacterium sp.]